MLILKNYTAHAVVMDNKYSICNGENSNMQEHIFSFYDNIKDHVLIICSEIFNQLSKLQQNILIAESSMIYLISDDVDEYLDVSNIYVFENVEEAVYFAHDINKNQIIIIGNENMYEESYHLIDEVLIKFISEVDESNETYNCEISGSVNWNMSCIEKDVEYWSYV